MEQFLNQFLMNITDILEFSVFTELFFCYAFFCIVYYAGVAQLARVQPCQG